jgi:hypothetical protein
VQIRLKQLPATFIKSLRRVMIAHLDNPRGLGTNCALMTFAYRKAMKHLCLEISHHAVVEKLFDFTHVSFCSDLRLRETTNIDIHTSQKNAVVSKPTIN